MKLSTSPFALGHLGVIRWCVNPICLAYSANWYDWKAGPLSVLYLIGVPRIEYSRSSAFLTWTKDVALILSIAAHLLYSS